MSTPVDRSERYLVIGAGPSGLVAARSLARAGIPYDMIDRNPDVGGIWDIRNDWSPMYESAHFISSKKMSHLPGYPMPDEYPDYPNHRQIFAYLQAFARAFDLYKHFEPGVTIERVDRDERGGWLVRFASGEERRYRGLFLCTGNTWDPIWPSYPGEFTGEGPSLGDLAIDWQAVQRQAPVKSPAGFLDEVRSGRDADAERRVDFVGDAGDQAAQRCELFRLQQLALGQGQAVKSFL